MSDASTTPLTERAKKIGHSDYSSSMVAAPQQLANAVESIAIQMSLINQKIDLLIEVIERVAQRP
jgi:hypothetical protein